MVRRGQGVPARRAAALLTMWLWNVGIAMRYDYAKGAMRYDYAKPIRNSQTMRSGSEIVLCVMTMRSGDRGYYAL